MKRITVSFAEYAAVTEPMTVEQWANWYQARGIEPDKVIRRVPNADQQADVYECQD